MDGARMDPIYDRNGKVVAWFRRGDTIVDRLGRYRAIVSEGGIFDYHAHFLGQLHGGYLWDRDGKAVAFVNGAADGPVLPPAGAISLPPVAGPEPARPAQPLVADRIPAYSKQWSELNWEDFLRGRHLFIAYSG